MTRVRAIEILRPGPPGEGMDPGQVAEIEAFKDRTETREYDIRRFGAVADGSTDNADAILDAIDEADGNWVVVPPGDFVTGQINVTGVARIRLEEGARLILRPGTHTDELIYSTGTELVIRGPGILDGNRHNTTSRGSIRAECPEGSVLDIDGVHFKSFNRGTRIVNVGGYINFSNNTITDQGQHGLSSGQHTTILSVISGDPDAASPFLRTNFNRAIFTEAETEPGSAPGGFFVDSRYDPGPESDGTAAPVKWEAIGNYFYGYGQNHSNNEIGCLHSYPGPAQCRFIGNHFEHFNCAPVNIKSTTDLICIGNTILNTKESSAYVTEAGSLLYAPGYHAASLQRYRAIIMGNTIDNSGGDPVSGSSGIVINSTAESLAKEVIVANNSIRTRGSGVTAQYGHNILISGNIIREHDGASTFKRGINLNNVMGDVVISGNLIERDSHAIAHLNTSPAGRVFVKGNVAKCGGPIDLRGLGLVEITGNTVERTTAGHAISVTSWAGTNVGKLIYDRTNKVLSGTVSLVHESITAFEGQEPLLAVPTSALGAAAGSGATRSVSGDGDKGTITLTTGTGTTTGDLLTLTRARRNAPVVTLSPANAAAASVNAYVSASTSSAFTISVADAPLEESTQYQWRYRID